MLPPESLRISDSEMHKIFPKDYYRKYAKHFEILELEQKMMDEEQQKVIKKQINFEHRIKEKQPQLPESVFRKTKIFKFDDYQETIDKNKQELRRQNKYASLINLKVKLGPTKKPDEIKPPLQKNYVIEEKVLDRLQAYEDLEYQEQLKKKEKKKKIQQQKMKCKFVAKSLRNSPRKSLYDNPQSSNRSPRTDKNLIENLEKVAAKSLSRNLSLQFSAEDTIKQKTNQASYINNINEALKVSHKMMKRYPAAHKDETKIARGMSHSKIMTMSSKKSPQRTKKLEQRKDLIEETKKIREQVNEMSTLKRYEQMLSLRALKKSLASTLNS